MRRSMRCLATFKKFKADYSVIPWATFIDPEVARVGLNEQEAKEKGIAFEVTRYGIDDLDRAIADGEAHGFVKVLTVPGKDRILGVTIVGTHAGDLLAEYVLAMKHGLGLNKILGTIHTYPTLAEANKYAAGEWKRAHQRRSACWHGCGATTTGSEAEMRRLPRRAGCARRPPAPDGRSGAAAEAPASGRCLFIGNGQQPPAPWRVVGVPGGKIPLTRLRPGRAGRAQGAAGRGRQLLWQPGA